MWQIPYLSIIVRFLCSYKNYKTIKTNPLNADYVEKANANTEFKIRIPVSSLTSLNEEELLRLCAHLIWGGAVIAPKVIFKLRGYLVEEKIAANIWRAVNKTDEQMCVSNTLKVTPVFVHYSRLFFICCFELYCCWIIHQISFPQWSWKKTLDFKSMLMKSLWQKECLCTRGRTLHV